MDALVQDLRFAWRTLRRSWRITWLAVAALGVGIGACTAIFSVVDGVLLRPLPYGGSDRLVMLWSHWERWPQTWVSEPEFADYQRDLHSAEHLAAFGNEARTLSAEDAPEELSIAFATGDLFATLGVHPALGRAFGPSDDQPGAPRVVVISDALWRRRFGGNRDVIGRTVRLSDTSATVIGVMPPAFQLPLDFAAPVDGWMSLAHPVPDPTDRGNHGLNLVIRLRPGVSVATAQREVDAYTAHLRQQYPNDYTNAFGATLVPVKTQVLGTIESPLLLLLGAVLLVLLVACANVANLLLARAEGRQREIAVRTAIGASGGRLARQLVTESLLLACMGGALGLLLGALAVRAFLLLAPGSIPRVHAVTINGRVLLGTLAATLLTGVLFGLAPALHGARADLQSVLRGTSRGTSAGRGRRRLRHALVVGELALSLLLLTGGALLLQSFVKLRNVDAGFDPEGVVTMRVSLPPATYPGHGETRAFFQALLDRARALPGVTGAGAVRLLPTTETLGDRGFMVQGERDADGKPMRSQGDWQIVTPGYFQALRIPVRRGRNLSDADDARSPQVILFNESLAARMFPSGDALGHRIRMGGDTAWRTVIGVVGDVRTRGLDQPVRGELYLPHAQWPSLSTSEPSRSMIVVVRSAGDPEALIGALRRQVRALDVGVPLSEVRTMHQVLSRWFAQRRLTALVLGALAGAALLLAAIGIYGVTSYTVAQRTHEIGIRMALGAVRGDVLRMVLRQGAGLTLIGIGLGVVAALLLARALAGLLYGVPPRDPITLLATAVMLGAVATVATYIPARRATQVDPLEAMRTE